MEIVNGYEDMIAYYRSRIQYADDELYDGMRLLRELETLVPAGWDSRAGNEVVLRLEELRREGRYLQDQLEDIRTSLAQCQAAMEEEMMAAAAMMFF